MRVIIIGAGGHGKVVLDTLLTTDQKVAGFLDDSPQKQNLSILGVKVLGTLNKINEFSEQLSFAAFVAIGDNFKRKEIFLKLNKLGFTLIKAISPQAYVFDKNKVGAGTLVMPKAVINIDAVVAENCIINTGAVVEHECRIGDHSHIASQAVLGGNVTVGEEVLIGSGAVVLPNLKIGDRAIVGAGAVVLHDVPLNTVVAGNPAKEINSKK